MVLGNCGPVHVQARRTGTSSPLGVFLDHNIDALNITLSTMNVLSMLQAGTSKLECWLIWVLSSSPFFFTTWDQYYTGVLHLGFMNGPSDGVLLLCGALVTCACVEDYTAFWDGHVAVGISREAAVIAFYGVCVFFTLLANVVSVAQNQQQHPRVALVPALADTLPFCMSLAGGALWLSWLGHETFTKEPRLVFWFFGIVFQELVTHLQLAHICSEDYRPWRMTLGVPVLLLVGNSVAGVLRGYHGGPPVNEVLLLQCCTAFGLLSWFHLVWCVTHEMASILGISVFSITPKSDATSSSNKRSS